MMLRIGNIDKGFTLIEVLLAISILAIGIIGVLRVYAISIDSLEISQENIEAVCLLRQKMAEIEQIALEQEGISIGVYNGGFKDGFKGYVWKLEVSATENKELNETILTISRKGKRRKFSLATYMENKDVSQ